MSKKSKSFSKNADKNGTIEGVDQNKPELPVLFYFSIFLQILSVCMGFGGFIFFMYHFLTIPLAQVHNGEDLAGFYFTRKSTHLVIISFFGFMLLRPSLWLYDLAKEPKTFFHHKSKYIDNYHPIVWASFWLVLTSVIFFVIDTLRVDYKVARLVFDVLFSHSIVIITQIFLSLLCIVIIEYYKRLLAGHEGK